MDHDRRSGFEKQLRLLIEAGSFAEAEQLILVNGAEADTAKIAAALDRPLSLLSIEDWTSVGADMEDAKRQLSTQDKGKEWRAAFAGLINNSRSDLRVRVSFGLNAEPQKPKLRKLDFMTNAEFEALRRDVESRTHLPEGRRYASPQSDGLRLRGLDDLWQMERAQPATDAPPAERDRYQWRRALAAAAILLRFHQLVERYAADPGLPRDMPLFGHVERRSGPREPEEFDFGIEANRLLHARSDHFDHAGAQQIVERRAAEKAESFLTDTRRIICELREKQEAADMWPLWVQPGRRMLFSGFVRQNREAVKDALKTMHGTDAARAKGEILYRLIAEARHPAEPEKALEPLAPEDRTELHKIAIAYAKRFGGKTLQVRFADTPEPDPDLVGHFFPG